MNGKFYFNKYKTSDTYGLAKVDVPKELDSILKKWLKINPSEYVLISSNNKPLSSSQITKMLNKIFGKEVSVNMLHMGRQEFEDCMEHLNINTFKNSDYYPIRLKKEYADLWKCH